jgi:hypothetical protein
MGSLKPMLSRIISHHSKEATRLEALLTLLRVVRREIHAHKEHGSRLMPPSRAMRKAWDSGLYLQPANFVILTGLWRPRNEKWTEDWLRLLRLQSATTADEWQQLRRCELTVAANRGRLDAISRFYTGNELQRLLHPRPPPPHSPALYTDIPDSVTVTGDSGALATFKDDLGPDKAQLEILDGAVRVSGIHPADLHWVLSLVERGGLGAALDSERQRRLGMGCLTGSALWSRSWRLWPRPPKRSVCAVWADSYANDTD